MSQSPDQKVIKLRRLTRPNELVDSQLINRNLEPLRQNNKKQIAQRVYYQKRGEHLSPLIRNQKDPVHLRLGSKHVQFKRLVPLGTNTASLLPKMKNTRLFFRNNNSKQPNNNGGTKVGNTPGQFRKNKFNRMYSAQARLERIRQNNRIKNSPIKLRRLNTQLPPATDLTVHVKNTNFVPPDRAIQYENGVQKFKMILDPVIQQEIAEVQRSSSGSTDIILPTTRITPEVTDLPITTRFSLL
ncbi:uncharacterized protein LOC109538629 [Dendroctonus ponderosae]|uniref:Uncharacterized protein n=1 Tax=Dendroctonus ponderosae TaxID=77166 RepID=A0AAR5PKE3_DENPD|nr:uncharacterized protein LOC109538629 [Dendroctonus ponderosae]KAH1013361.1 hypothetical protein HUJ04_002362 [Dendroctonus ponderosae]KAH1024723.1 hypothetical protein HUJ05_004166 [Dendroctonus ponderosae]